MKRDHIQLSEEEKNHIKELLSKGDIKSRVSLRLTSLLLLNEQKTYKEVASILQVRLATISDWKKKYKLEGLKSLLEEKPRSGRPAGLTGENKAKITALACSTPPEGYSRWTLRMLADKVVELGYVDEISHTHVQEILKKTNLSLTSKNSGV
ncbi:helix-turn-helix domain-containing protein [Flammeovirga sp. EKP202]|uniref:helix-turn-helix domain-containing protein n=1 Tax=Flammeovirga sp. EKP202 TaxID=2770592 RepID=UPI00165F6535|nr:helix-turn-helix domain-containing protein [Flammeovirga sp. EKP202]MBD0405498.1 helix-turn-helix domain-containing protein [Flammeovirga sp. EKP202]